MTVEELIIQAKKQIHSTQAKMLLANILDMSPLEIYNHLNLFVEEEKSKLFLEQVDKVANNEPIQYVTGIVNFYGLEFDIDENVLIPRPETEELVEWTSKIIKEHFKEDVSIIDLGTGSGVIGLTLKNQFPDSSVTLLDISPEALDVAKRNAQKLNLEVLFLKNDMLDNINEKYDVIISNPPYINQTDIVDDIVLKNEPHIALFADENGLFYYRKILSTIQKNLNDKYLIAFEIGSTQKDEIINIINEYLIPDEIITKKDLSERDRMIFIIKK